MDIEKTKKYLTILEKIYSEQEDGKILPLYRLKDIIKEMKASPVMGTPLYRGLNYMEWDGESWRWIVEKPTMEHAQKLHTYFLSYGARGTKIERAEGKKNIKVLIKLRELLNNKYLKSTVIRNFLTENNVKFTITILQKHNYIFSVKKYGTGNIFKWFDNDDLTLQDGINLYRLTKKRSITLKKESIQNIKEIVKENDGIRNYFDFMSDLLKRLYRNKKCFEIKMSPAEINFDRLCEEYNVSKSIVHILEKTATFGWLKKINGYYVWDHGGGCSKKEVERIYRSVTFYDNKPKGEIKKQNNFNQICKFGFCELSKVISCTNTTWDYAPKKCHVIEQEDCEGYERNEKYVE
jgi:hypothetical protein